jgi:hypothetical protein
MARRGGRGDPISFVHDRLIIGEGPQDSAFFRALIADRNLPAAHVHSTEELSGMPGKSGFGEALARIRNLTGFQNLKHIVLTTDSDKNARDSFREVADLVRNVRAPGPHEPPHSYPVPIAQHKRADGEPSVTILMVPWKGKVGALETLCFEAAIRNRAAAAQCVDQFARCARTNTWSPQKRAKMNLRSLVTSIHERNPDIGFGKIWEDAPDLIPISDHAFSQIAKFLKNV